MEEQFLKDVKGQPNLPRWFSSIFKMIQSPNAGSLIIQLPDNRKFIVESKKPGANAYIVVKNEHFFSRLVREGQNGFSESYMDGWWDTPDLQAVLDFFLLAGDDIYDDLIGTSVVRLYERLNHWLKSNWKFQARKNISYHYDLGNQFYREWLDKTMTYSSALFKNKKEVLSSAQTNKYESICKNLNLKVGDSVLEIGCGWGGFAEHAIKTRGVKLTGLTLSKEQLDYSKKRMFELGMADKSSFLLQDYRDEKGVYDGVVSIEMFEAVGEKYWPTYFKTIKNSLKSGGLGCLQVITIDDKYFPKYRKSVDFLQKYIFPGGMLPSYTALVDQIRSADLEFIRSKEFGQSYSKTLRIWSQRFNSKWDRISELGFDDRFRRMWNFYLTSCASFFFSGAGDVTQVTLKKN